jgi:hypothetical protein
MSMLTDYSVNDTPMLMDIRSDTLEPISGTNLVSNRFVFRLDQAGYLDSNSMLLFKCVNPNNNNQSRVNMINGGLGAIKRATFQVGDYIINDVDGANVISTLMNMTTQPPSVRNRYNGWYYHNCLHAQVMTAGDATAINTDIGGNGSIIVDSRISGLDKGASNNNNNGVAINSCRISNVEAGSYQIGIPLGVLFPALKGRTMPLFLFQDYRILLTFEFHDGAEFCNKITEVEGTAPNAATGRNPGLINPFQEIQFADVKLQVDYVIMPASVQNKDREMTNQEGGLRLDFLDSIRVEKQLVAGTAGTEQEVEHRIGADNKEVHKIYMTRQFTDTAVNNKQPAQYAYGQQRIDGIPVESYNVNIDGINVFHDFKDNPASQYDETSNCLGKDLKTPRGNYINDPNTLMCGLAPPRGGLQGQYKPLCLDLTNGNNTVLGGGRTIGAYPIIWKYRRNPTAAIANRCDAKNGAMNINYYMLVSKTATIRSTPMGTNILVSY